MVGAVAVSTMATMQPAWNAAFSIQGASARAPKYALHTPAWYSPARPAASTLLLADAAERTCKTTSSPCVLWAWARLERPTGNKHNAQRHRIDLLNPVQKV